MRASSNHVPSHSAVDSASAALAVLAVSIGTAGLAAAATRPGLLAEIDQHAAAVRDSLGGDRRPLTAAALAGYAEGVRDAAREHGWQPPTRSADWSASDWLLTRLLAVCALARSLGARPAAPPAP
ncbi:hypothetical protein E1258_26285 [Micromonospora sp. KC207]|uniref:DUF6401 family natural product biosynthesis protein n=1 Tax=Micromonospora sp. KC207 TaxID=2530377 RepID=UPI0010511CA8|nr:DUF6401 family natural product biosynthesis protein [Micromonospora sp. KC207]TDC50659.1 hypothetical protein E1258_26285 [Micromonospora sp. KC207]